jgi:hypothetical protein
MITTAVEESGTKSGDASPDTRETIEIGPFLRS